MCQRQAVRKRVLLGLLGAAVLGVAISAVATRGGSERADVDAPREAEPPPAPRATRRQIPAPTPAQRTPSTRRPCGARRPTLRDRASRAVGLPHRGRLVDGVRLPCQGANFFTWDPIPRSSPNRSWRRHGTARLVRTVLSTVDAFAAANPSAPRIGVGDLSRPRGGDFGPRFGRLGHVSHQNGLDVDVYYPRHDRRERRASVPRQVDRRLAQDLLDRFVAAGAQRVFVGPRVGLEGPPGVVQVVARHDDHMHVRLPGG